MTRAIVVPFHRYQPYKSDRYKVFLDTFVNSPSINGDEVDTVYLIDSGYGFDEKDLKKLRDKGVEPRVLPCANDGGSWWENIRRATKLIKEDLVMFLDMDVVFWETGIIKGWFDLAKDFDVVTSFDSSGGMRDEILGKYPGMKCCNGVRMGTYYFVVNRKVLTVMGDTDLAPIQFKEGAKIKELDYVTKEGDWLDALGYLTLRLLDGGFSFRQIVDNRSSFYLEDNGDLISDPGSNCDVPGYYHIRNGNMPIYLLDTYEDFKVDFERKLEQTPRRETLRLMAWHKYLGMSENDIIILLGAMGLPKHEWDIYFSKFKEYHKI